MEILCPVDGETLSLFWDGELSPLERRTIDGHLSRCASCQTRLGRYRLADGIMSSTRFAAPSRPPAGRFAASLSVAAALVASVAANILLTPKAREPERPPLRLSAAPSEILTSFYAKVAPQGRPLTPLKTGRAGLL